MRRKGWLGVFALLMIAIWLAYGKAIRDQLRRDETAIRAFCRVVVERMGAQLRLVTDLNQCEIKSWDASFSWAEYIVIMDHRTTLWVVRTMPLNPLEDGVNRVAEVNQGTERPIKLKLDPRTGWLSSGRND